MRLLREYIQEILTEGGISSGSGGEEQTGGSVKVKFSGILKINSIGIIEQARGITGQEDFPKETEVSKKPVILLPEENLHVTLAHQSVLKPFKKALKTLFPKNGVPELKDAEGNEIVPPSIKLNDTWEKREDLETGRISYVAWVDNHKDVEEYLNKVMKLVGGPENLWKKENPQRKFHVSLANLSGKPGDSVR